MSHLLVSTFMFTMMTGAKLTIFRILP